MQNIFKWDNWVHHYINMSQLCIEQKERSEGREVPVMVLCNHSSQCREVLQSCKVANCCNRLLSVDYVCFGPEERNVIGCGTVPYPRSDFSKFVGSGTLPCCPPNINTEFLFMFINLCWLRLSSICSNSVSLMSNLRSIYINISNSIPQMVFGIVTSETILKPVWTVTFLKPSLAQNVIYCAIFNHLADFRMSLYLCRRYVQRNSLRLLFVFNDLCYWSNASVELM